MNRIRSSLSMRSMALGNSFKLRPNSRALGLGGSVMTIVLTINGCSHSQGSIWDLSFGGEVPSGRRPRAFYGVPGGHTPRKFFEINMRLQRLDEIHAGPSFLLRNQEEDKRRLYWQDEK